MKDNLREKWTFTLGLTGYAFGIMGWGFLYSPVPMIGVVLTTIAAPLVLAMFVLVIVDIWK